MKNLTANPLSMLQHDGSRLALPAHSNPPTLVVQDPVILGVFFGFDIVREKVVTVDFHDIELNPQDQPFIVSREIFDALPEHRVEFVTPDYDSAIYNALQVPHVIRRFLAKAKAMVTIPEAPIQNNQL